jgi:phage regulator Rha-like protein
MIQLLNSNGFVSIDSKEIADITGKKHSHVCRDIRNQLKEQDINESIFGSVYFDKKNEQRNCFALNYEQTMILVSGYSIALRAKIIKRWTELEEKYKPQLPQSFSEALQLAADQAKQLELQAPKVALADESIRDKTTHYSITAGGKQIGLSQSKIFNLMREKRLLTVKKLPTQLALDKNFLTLRTNIVNGKNRPQAVMNMENIFNFKRVYEKDFK